MLDKGSQQSRCNTLEENGMLRWSEELQLDRGGSLAATRSKRMVCGILFTKFGQDPRPTSSRPALERASNLMAVNVEPAWLSRLCPRPSA